MTRQHMADMRLAVCRRWSIIKSKRIRALALVNRFLSDAMILPELFYFLFTLNKIQIRINFTIQTKSPLK